MDNERKGNDAYPPGFEHIKEIVDNAKEQVRQIDEQIKNLLKNQRGPTLRLDPIGAYWSRQVDNRAQQKASLEKKQKEIKEEAFNKIEQELKKADPEMARTVRDNILEDLYGNEFKTMSVAERNIQRGEPKEIDASQRFMMSMFSSRRTVPGKDDIEPDKN